MCAIFLGFVDIFVAKFHQLVNKLLDKFTKLQEISKNFRGKNLTIHKNTKIDKKHCRLNKHCITPVGYQTSFACD